MTKPINSYGEKGAFMALVAVVAFVLLIIIVGLGVDGTLVKQESEKLKLRLTEACKIAANYPVLQRRAVEKFSVAIRALRQDPFLERVSLTEVNLIDPTMPEDGSFSDDTDIDPTIRRVAFRDVDANFNCQLKGGGDCTFFGDVRDATVSASFPESLWNNHDGVGVFIGCEASGTVETFMSGSKPVYAKVVFSRKVRGNFFHQPPGLSMAIAPQMTTEAKDPRFRFHRPYEDSFLQLYNPLRWTGASLTSRAFDATFTDLAYDFIGASRVANYQAVISDLTGGGAGRRIPDDCAGGEEDVYLSCTPENAIFQLSDREQMLAACMNPVVMIRNALFSLILEYASRHGELRNTTELLVANPQHMFVQTNPEYPRDVLSGDLISNRPVSIVAYGEDLASKIFQLPYMFFHGGGDSMPAPYGDMGPDRNGWINPFSSADVNWQQHHALMAGQLRYCYHMFSGGANNGIDRADLNFELANLNFEPDIYTRESKLRGKYPGSFLNWDQPCPYSGFNGCVIPGAAGAPRKLSAAEVVASLGTVQRAPFEMDLPSGVKLSKPSPNTNVNQLNDDLRPDLLGLVKFFKREDDTRAIASPGLFPVSLPNNFVMPLGNDIALYDEATNKYAPILIVLHQRMSDVEATAIRGLVTAAGSSITVRPITIVYLPTTATDSDQAAIDTLKWAFDIPSLNPNPLTDNVLYVFSPYLARYNPDHPDHNNAIYDGSDPEFTGLEWERFRDYWLYLLTDSENNIFQVATRIFFERILRLELSF